MANYDIRFTGINELEALFADAVKMNDVKEIVKRETAYMQQLEQRQTPVDTAFLKRSETLSIEDGGLTGKVETNAEYAEYQEVGTRWIYGKFYAKRANETAGNRFLASIERLMK